MFFVVGTMSSQADKKMTTRFHAVIELCKVKISFFSAFSAVTGFALAAPQISWKIFTLAAGVFLLASGCCALNQYQERDTDSLMTRTKGRPIPSKRMGPFRALLCAFMLIGIGFVVLGGVGNPVVMAIGLVALFWYNGFYTPLKKMTPWAAIPGALTGTLPPCMGWLAGGGAPEDPLMWSLGILFFFFQIPHFWLVHLQHSQDLKRAGLPSLATTFTRRQMARITLVWTVSLSVVCLMVPWFGLLSPVVILLLGAAGVWLCWNGITCFKNNTQWQVSRRIFRDINVYMLIVMGGLAADGIFRAISGSIFQ